MSQTDNRIAYGALCTWWDSISQVGKTPPGADGHCLPCCPYCGGVLFEMVNEDKWFAGADKYERAGAGHPGYRKMIEWGRGRCFRTYTDLKSAYDAEK